MYNIVLWDPAITDCLILKITCVSIQMTVMNTVSDSQF